MFLINVKEDEQWGVPPFCESTRLGMEGEERPDHRFNMIPQSNKRDNLFEDFKSESFDTMFSRDLYPEFD